MSGHAERRIVIIGSGFGGLGLAIRLKRRGIDSFTILEQAERLGGTWRDNAYPGAACDVPSILYSFSFEPKTDWSRHWSPQAEILAYMEDCARRNDVLRHVRFGARVTGARFDEQAGTWTVRLASGEELVADVLVSSVGQLHEPSTPAIRGIERFRGAAFHSAQWDRRCDLAGKRVAVIGNAASAIQLVPEVARVAARTTVFQRSANWMVPRGDRPYAPWERWLLAHVPGFARAWRAYTWLRLELWLYPLMRGRTRLRRPAERASRRYMEEIVADPRLRAALTPDYPMGGRRILLTDGYYEALCRDDVEVVTDAIDHVEEDAVVGRDGRRHPADVIVFATGFRTNPFLASMRIEGRGGRLLADDWADGAYAYYGMTVPGYPNFFVLYGPNTNLGHNSIVFMFECQIRYVLSALDLLAARDLRFLDVKPAVVRAFNERLQAALRESAWAAAGQSWYKDAAGRITNNWPWSTCWYWWRTRALDPADYELAARDAARPLSVPPARPRPASAPPERAPASARA